MAELATDAIAAHALREQPRYLNLNATQSDQITIDDHDLVIFFGDLNYRIAEDVRDEDVLAFIHADMCLELSQKCDQLILEMDAGRAFAGFHEGLLLFPPTYKYIPGTAELDTRPHKKNRCPAWCDRILWRTRAGPAVHLVEQHIQLDLVEGVSGTNNGAETEASMSADNGTATAASPSRANKATRRFKKLKDVDIGDGYTDVSPSSSGTTRRSTSCDFGANGLETPDGITVQLMNYNSIKNFLLSDHRPVAGFLNIRARRVDWAAREQLLLNIANTTIPVTQPDMLNKFKAGKALLAMKPNHALMYSHDREFSQLPIEVVNQSDQPLWWSVRAGALAGTTNPYNHNDSELGWLRISYTPAEVDGQPSGSPSEWTTAHYADPVEIPPHSSIWVQLICNNIAAMHNFADARNQCQRKASHEREWDVIEPMLEDLIEVGVIVDIDVLGKPLTGNAGGTQGGDAPQPMQKISSLCMPITLILGPETDGAKGSTQIDTPSMNYRLQRVC